jgi:ion channel-forming bestrophin family protein
MIDYDPHRWRTFFHFRGTLIDHIWYRACGSLVWAIAVACVHHFWHPLDMSELGHSLIGAALSLLLVFRTNASYDRFWEGRKLWGALVNTSRNLARVVSVHLKNDATLHDRALRLTIAFVHATMHELRGGKGLGPVASELPREEVEAWLSAVHTPTRVAQEISVVFQRAYEKKLVTDVQQMAIDHHASVLIDCVGACERIHKTPLPFAYVVHLRRAIVIYCSTLPFALLARFGWYSIAVSFIIATILFGIEEIGVEIEDPFGTDDNDLPLEAICANIERNVRPFLLSATA